MKHSLDEFMDILKLRTSQRSLTPSWIMFRFGGKSEVEAHRVRAWLEPRGFRMEVPLTTQEAYMMVHDLWPETFDDTVQKACEQGRSCTLPPLHEPQDSRTRCDEVWPQERVTSDLTERVRAEPVDVGNLAWAKVDTFEEHAAHLPESPLVQADVIADDDEQDDTMVFVDQVERAGWVKIYVEAWRNANTAPLLARADAAATHASLFLQHYHDTFDAAEEEEGGDDGL